MENHELNLTEQEIVRREKLKDLEAKGILPGLHPECLGGGARRR